MMTSHGGLTLLLVTSLVCHLSLLTVRISGERRKSSSRRNFTTTTTTVMTPVHLDYDEFDGMSSARHDDAYGSASKCVDVPLNGSSLCRGIGYTRMRLPNFLEHETLDEVTAQSVSWTPLVSTRCDSDVQIFLCSLLSPVCLEDTVLPCRSLCLKVKASCERVMLNYGYPWPQTFDCDRFPATGDLCISGQHGGNDSNATGPEQQQRLKQNALSPDTGKNSTHLVCAKDLNLDALRCSYCAADFVIKTKLSFNGHDVEISAAKLKFYRGSITSQLPPTKDGQMSLVTNTTGPILRVGIYNFILDNASDLYSCLNVTGRNSTVKPSKGKGKKKRKNIDPWYLVMGKGSGPKGGGALIVTYIYKYSGQLAAKMSNALLSFARDNNTCTSSSSSSASVSGVEKGGKNDAGNNRGRGGSGKGRDDSKKQKNKKHIKSIKKMSGVGDRGELTKKVAVDVQKSGEADAANISGNSDKKNERATRKNKDNNRRRGNKNYEISDEFAEEENSDGRSDKKITTGSKHKKQKKSKKNGKRKTGENTEEIGLDRSSAANSSTETGEKELVTDVVEQNQNRAGAETAKTDVAKKRKGSNRRPKKEGDKRRKSKAKNKKQGPEKKPKEEAEIDEAKKVD